MNPQTETEWQFSAPALESARAWLAAQPRDRSERHFAPRSTLELNDTYFDSPDWMIFRAGFALRMRVEKDADSHSSQTEITLKSLAPSREGLARRVEISERVEGSDITTAFTRETGMGQRIRDLVGSRELLPLFRARTRRERQQLIEADSDLPLAEVDLDETSIEAANGTARAFTRVEIECLNAEPAAIEPWVAQLRDAASLTPVEASKFRTGLVAAGLDPNAEAELGSFEVGASQPFETTQLALLRRYFHALDEKEPGVRLESGEAVHDMRVAARHLDVLLRLFEGHGPPWTEGARQPLREIIRALGAVRDIEVQIGRLEELAGEMLDAERDAVAHLRERLVKRREEARRQLLAVLDSERIRHFRTNWMDQLRRGGERSAPTRETPTAAFARDLIRREAKKLRKLGDAIGGDSTADDFHAVRKRAKRLRYAVESFASFWGEPADDYVRALGKLQQLLGAYHDGVVRAELFSEFATKGEDLPASMSFAIGRLVERDERVFEDCRAHFGKAWRRVRRRRWRALREVMDRVAKETGA